MTEKMLKSDFLQVHQFLVLKKDGGKTILTMIVSENEKK